MGKNLKRVKLGNVPDRGDVARTTRPGNSNTAEFMGMILTELQMRGV
jgi:hypothetical protein